MKKNKDLPSTIPIFPLSNFIIFPDSRVPLNIFEPRYLEMIDDAMKNSKLIGIIQPKKDTNNSKNNLYEIGCVGKIVSFNETEDGRYMVVLNGMSRFKVLKEVDNNKLYRECEISFEEFKDDLNIKKKEINFTNLNLILKDLKKLFEKNGYTINWKELEKQNLGQTVNTLAMASPFSIEEKQALLETKNLDLRKNKLAEILNTYVLDNYSNTTIQ